MNTTFLTANSFNKNVKTPAPDVRALVRVVAATMPLAAVVVLAPILVTFGLNDESYALLLCAALPVALLSLRATSRPVAPARRPAAVAHPTSSSQKRILIDTGNAMLARTRRNHEPMSIIVFDQNDLRELLKLFGAVPAREMVAKMAATLSKLAGPQGLALRTGSTEFTVLMPGTRLDQALAGVRQALGNTYSFEGGGRGDEILLVPDFLAQAVRGEVESIEDVYRSMRAAIRQAQKNTDLRQDYMRRERESHTSRPAALSSAVSTTQILRNPIMTGSSSSSTFSSNASMMT